MITENLRQQTLTAIAEGKLEARIEATVEQERLNRLQQVADEIKAQEVIEQIPCLARKAARAGKSYAIVMWFDDGDDYKEHHEHTRQGDCKPEWLVGAEKLVYDACAAAGLNPVIQNGLDESYQGGMLFISIPI